MKIKFKTFHPYCYAELDKRYRDAAEYLNAWLKENPKVEVISWQATPVGSTNEIYITIQYRELED